MIVYRIETEEGVGPHRNGKAVGDIENLLDEKLNISIRGLLNSSHKPPDVAFTTRCNWRFYYSNIKKYDWRFGFKRITDVHRWCIDTSIIRGLGQLGYYIAEYKIHGNRVMNSLDDNQLIFQRCQAELIKRTNMQDYYNSNFTALNEFQKIIEEYYEQHLSKITK